MATITLGYLFLAFIVIASQTAYSIFIYLYKTDPTQLINQSSATQIHPLPNANANEDANINADINADAPHDNHDNHARGLASMVLNCAAAVVKVGLLLFLKMLFLPMLLGLWLDFTTLSLFHTSIHDRVMYAASDFFGSLLMHWVAGITSMLLVTVSVLQLRELVHPDLLAKFIRPQEPQPDLLGNLLQESGLTHIKRMVFSFFMYFVLLSNHIWLPAKILVTTGIANYLPFF
jgi:hypothetical protein